MQQITESYLLARASSSKSMQPRYCFSSVSMCVSQCAVDVSKQKNKKSLIRNWHNLVWTLDTCCGEPQWQL